MKQLEVLEHYKKTLLRGSTPTYQDVGDRLGITPSSVYKHVGKLVDAGYLVKDSAGRIGLTGEASRDTKKIPVLGKIACGLPLEVFETYDKVIEVPPSILKGGGDYYALEASGSSMEGMGIYDGDILVIKSQTDVNDGDIGVMIEQDNFEERATLKSVFHTKAGLLGKPSNPRFDPIVISNKKAEIRGKLISIISIYE